MRSLFILTALINFLRIHTVSAVMHASNYYIIAKGNDYILSQAHETLPINDNHLTHNRLHKQFPYTFVHVLSDNIQQVPATVEHNQEEEAITYVSLKV